MATVVKIQDNHEGYRDVLSTVLGEGRLVDSRNGKTLEVEDLVIEVANPIYAAPIGVRPNYNDAIGVVEGLQLIAGVSDPGLTAEIQPMFRNFMEPDTGKFWGAYGARTHTQFPGIVERLRHKEDTRQAVITLWDPEYDLLDSKKDYPCTTAFFFLIRDNRLNMKVVMRSADMIWGWCYDAVQFSMVLQTMANLLMLQVGTLTLHAVSGHIYEPHWDMASEVARSNTVTHERQPTLAFTGADWKEAQQQAFQVYRVVTGTLGAEVLTTPVQQALASQLLTRRTKVIADNLEKVNKLDGWR